MDQCRERRANEKILKRKRSTEEMIRGKEDHGNTPKTQVMGLDLRNGGTYSVREEAGQVALPSAILKHLS